MLERMSGVTLEMDSVRLPRHFQEPRLKTNNIPMHFAQQRECTITLSQTPEQNHELVSDL